MANTAITQQEKLNARLDILEALENSIEEARAVLPHHNSLIQARNQKKLKDLEAKHAYRSKEFLETYGRPAAIYWETSDGEEDGAGLGLSPQEAQSGETSAGTTVTPPDLTLVTPEEPPRKRSSSEAPSGERERETKRPRCDDGPTTPVVTATAQDIPQEVMPNSASLASVTEADSLEDEWADLLFENEGVPVSNEESESSVAAKTAATPEEEAVAPRSLLVEGTESALHDRQALEEAAQKEVEDDALLDQLLTEGMWGHDAVEGVEVAPENREPAATRPLPEFQDQRVRAGRAARARKPARARQQRKGKGREDAILAEGDETPAERVLTQAERVLTQAEQAQIAPVWNFRSSRVEEILRATTLSIVPRHNAREFKIEDAHRSKEVRKFRYGGEVHAVSVVRLNKVETFRKAIREGRLETSPGHTILFDETDEIEIGDDVYHGYFGCVIGFLESGEYDLAKVLDEGHLLADNPYIRLLAHGALFTLAAQLKYPALKKRIFHKMQMEKVAFVAHRKRLYETDPEQALAEADEEADVLAKWQVVRSAMPNEFRSYNWAGDANAPESLDQAARGWRYQPARL